MKEDLKLLLRVHEFYESILQMVSDDIYASTAKQGYEHEFSEITSILAMLSRVIEREESEDK